MNRLLPRLLFIAFYRKASYALLLGCLLPVASFSQTPDWIWAIRGGSTVNDFSNSIAIDPLGNVIVCGWFNSPTMTIGSNTLTGNGLFDVFVAKYDPNGNPIWAVSAGSASDDYGNAVTVDASGNIYVTGYFSGNTITFGSTVLANASPGSGDIFLVKYDPAGNVLFADSYGGNDWDVGQSVTTNTTGTAVYVAGYLASTSIDFGTGPLSTNGLADAFLAKFDANGNAQWSISGGGTVNDLANGVATDNAGNVFITGGFASTSITFGSNTMMNAGPGFPDIFTAKYDAAGNHIWSLREGGPDNDHTVALDIDPFDNVIVAGHYHSTSFVAGTTTLTNGGMGDPFIMKYTNAGGIIWARDAGGMDNDFAYTIETDSAGNSYLAGMYTSMSITFGSTTLMNASTLEDIFLTKYDSAGNVLWAKGGGGNFSDYINDVAIYPPTDKLFATGDFASNTLTLGSTVLTNTDNTGNTADHFVAKLDMITGSEVLNMHTISIVPNPSSGIVEIRTAAQDFTVSIFTVRGEKILETNEQRLDLSAYGKGLYLLHLKTGTESSFARIVIR